MTPDDGEPLEVIEVAVPPERALQAKALIHSCLCPGAGFALLGRKSLASATFIVLLGFLAAVIWMSFQPEPQAGWTALGLLLAGLVLGLGEQIALWLMHPRPPGPRILVAGFPIAS